jgi:methyl-accepting chemotaxis protein
MKLAAKLTIAMAAVSAVTALVVGGVGGMAAMRAGDDAMRGSVAERLEAVNDNRARELQNFLDLNRARVEYLALDPGTLDAFRHLTAGFNAASKAASGTPSEALRQYYREQYTALYAERNGTADVDPAALLRGAGPTAMELQHHYIASNPHPPGEKHKLDVTHAGGPYHAYHSLHHPRFRRFVETFEYYDLFLIEPEQGAIIYSVFKEVDFGTSLKNGPYADSGLAQAYADALNSGEVAFSRVAHYRPSYDDNALFVAAPIPDEAGNTLGVVALQVPVHQLDDLMTADGDWNSLGLGQSGETYLVGAHGHILTDLRQRAEHPQAFQAALAELDLPASALGAIRGREHPAGRIPEPSAAVTAAIDSNEAGLAVTRDLLGRDVIKAWQPVQLGGARVMLVSQQNVDEALAPLDTLQREISLSAGLVAVLVSALGGLVGWLVARRIARPVRELAGLMETVARERDLTQRFESTRRDEIGLIARAVDAMLTSFRDVIREVTDTAADVRAAASETAASSGQTHKQVGRQQEETREVAAAMTQMAASVEEVARHVQEVADATHEASSTCVHGDEQVRDLTTRISALAEQVATSSERIAALDADTRKVDEIVSMIAEIAEQTNLLALNAAIESARAGEHGRGFAVVADEVRALAGRSRSAAEEVRGTIGRLQGATGDASDAMQEQQRQCGRCVEAAQSTGESFAHISQRVGRITELTEQVAGAAEEQSQVAEDIDRRLANISSIAEESASASERVATASEQLSTQAQTMEQTARRFRT